MTNKKIITISVLAILFLLGCFAAGNVKSEEEMVGASFAGSEWFNVNSFDGYQTKLDPSKVSKGANPNGQNTTVFEGDRIGIRDLGYELFPTGTATTTAGEINSLHTFRKRSGENLLMRTQNTFIEYYNESNDIWETLKTGMTDDETYGFADQNINTDLQSRVYFGNDTDTAMYWTGAHGTIVGAVVTGSTTIELDDISGFTLATSSIVVCGATIQYSSLNISTKVFTLVGTAGVACANGKEGAQAPVEVETTPKGNLYMVAQNRLFISGVASSTQAIFFSAYADASDFTSESLVSDSTADSSGIFNLGEGGGGVTGMVQDESALYFFKKSIIYKAVLSDSLYSINALKPFDGKGQTVGAVNDKSIFTGGNTVFFITPDNQIMALLRVEAVDYPQIKPISNIIKPTVDAFNFDDSSGIVFRDKAYFSMKSNTSVTANDTVLVYNLDTGKWDSPVVGWNVDDWAVYDDTVTEELYYGHAINSDTYKVNTTPIDDIYSVTANWRSKQFSFGLPYAQKEVVDMYVDGYISPNTTLTISLLLDEDGYTQSFTTDIVGTDEDLVYDSSEYNTMGLNAFGTTRFGSQEDISGKKRWRVNLGKDFRAAPFYTAQVDFSSDGDGQEWEILNFGFKWRPYSTESLRTLYQAFK